MYISQRVIIKHENKIVEGNVEKIYDEDLEIRLDDNTVVIRKFWEIRKISHDD